MRGQPFFVAVCATLLLVACSDNGTPSSSEPPPSATASTIAESDVTTILAEVTTSAPPTTSTATIPAHTAFVPTDPFVAPEATSTGGGSGCSPGSGPLPDGEWFGFLDGGAETTIDFDLACFVSCEPGTGFAIGNQSSKIRSLPVDSAAVLIFEVVGGPDGVEPYETVENIEHAGLHNIAWVYVNDGAVTHIVLPADAQGCRYSEVDVEWTAQLSEAGHVAFNDLGLIASRSWEVEENLFYWRSGGWQSSAELEGDPRHGTEGSVAAASGETVAIGAHVHRWTGSSWSTDVFDALPGAPYALATSGDRVLLSGISGNDVIVYVLTWSGGSWSVDSTTVGIRGDWNNFAGAISGDTFAISDTGIDSSQPKGIVRVFSLDGTSWTETASLHDQWDTGNWGSSLDLDDDQLLVGADGANPGPGSPGGMYLYTRTGTTWTPEVVGEGGEGFGFSARIDGDTIVAAAAHSDETAIFWVFARSGMGWRGTPLTIDRQDPLSDWVTGIDVDESEVAVSTDESLWIGVLRP